MGKHDCLPEEREDFNMFCKMILTQHFTEVKQMEVLMDVDQHPGYLFPFS